VDVVIHHAELQDRSSFLLGHLYQKGPEKVGNARVDGRLAMSGCPDDMHIETAPHAA
jgi:hypothetical protein